MIFREVLLTALSPNIYWWRFIDSFDDDDWEKCISFSSKTFIFICNVRYVFQIFPSVGHNLQIIEKYFHKVVRHFITDSFNYEEQNEKDYQKLESGILKDISAWLNWIKSLHSCSTYTYSEFGWKVSSIICSHRNDLSINQELNLDIPSLLLLRQILISQIRYSFHIFW